MFSFRAWTGTLVDMDIAVAGREEYPPKTPHPSLYGIRLDWDIGTRVSWPGRTVFFSPLGDPVVRGSANCLGKNLRLGLSAPYSKLSEDREAKNGNIDQCQRRTEQREKQFRRCHKYRPARRQYCPRKDAYTRYRMTRTETPTKSKNQGTCTILRIRKIRYHRLREMLQKEVDAYTSQEQQGWKKSCHYEVRVEEMLLVRKKTTANRTDKEEQRKRISKRACYGYIWEKDMAHWDINMLICLAFCSMQAGDSTGSRDFTPRNWFWQHAPRNTFRDPFDASWLCAVNRLCESSKEAARRGLDRTRSEEKDMS
ncbi:hypothetical protein EDD85DRAFT_932034 [Armillaria nabsnona]|nr:hypothetical protein EDD85DRAFT_932034 [Armillaria nabsnona]